MNNLENIFNLMVSLKNVKKEKLYISQRNQLKIWKLYWKKRKKYRSYRVFLDEFVIYMIEEIKTIDQALEDYKNK